MFAPLKSARFTDYLQPSQIIHNLKASTKIEAIEELLDILVKHKLVKNKKALLTRIIDRERLESTGIGNSFALPHARVNTNGEIAVAVGRSKEGIDFESVDNQKVRVIILVIWNPSIPGLFNHLFAGLAKFLVDSNNRDRLCQAEDSKELYNILTEIDLRIPEHEDKIISRANLLKKLQTLEIQIKKAPKEKRKDLKRKAGLIREELDAALLDRFDRLMERYGFAVAEVEDGACQGCFINLATGMRSAIEGSNDIYVCENCGKFLISARKKKKS